MHSHAACSMRYNLFIGSPCHHPPSARVPIARHTIQCIAATCKRQITMWAHTARLPGARASQESPPSSSRGQDLGWFPMDMVHQPSAVKVYPNCATFNNAALWWLLWAWGRLVWMAVWACLVHRTCALLFIIQGPSNGERTETEASFGNGLQILRIVMFAGQKCSCWIFFSILLSLWNILSEKFLHKIHQICMYRFFLAYSSCARIFLANWVYPLGFEPHPGTHPL